MVSGSEGVIWTSPASCLDDTAGLSIPGSLATCISSSTYVLHLVYYLAPWIIIHIEHACKQCCWSAFFLATTIILKASCVCACSLSCSYIVPNCSYHLLQACIWLVVCTGTSDWIRPFSIEALSLHSLEHFEFFDIIYRNEKEIFSLCLLPVKRCFNLSSDIYLGRR